MAPVRAAVPHAQNQTALTTGDSVMMKPGRGLARLLLMPIPTDTFQDAWCDNEDILNHCRSDGPHRARGTGLWTWFLAKSNGPADSRDATRIVLIGRN